MDEDLALADADVRAAIGISRDFPGELRYGKGERAPVSIRPAFDGGDPLEFVAFGLAPLPTIGRHSGYAPYFTRPVELAFGDIAVPVALSGFLPDDRGIRLIARGPFRLDAPDPFAPAR